MANYYTVLGAQELLKIIFVSQFVFWLISRKIKLISQKSVTKLREYSAMIRRLRALEITND